MAISRMVGARIKRREDPRLITGAATYVDDIKLYDMQYLALLRSVYAHAKIVRLNASKALAGPGVAAVLTGEDVRRASAPLPTAGGVEDLKVPDHDAMPEGKVCPLGQPVAGVIARDRYAAREAPDRIEVDCEPLPVVVDVEKAMEAGSPLVHEQFGSNVAYTWLVEGGDIEQGFKDADVVVKQRMTNQRLIPNPMETRGVVAQYEPGPGILTVWSSTQIPHILRSSLAALLNLAENKVRVVAPEVGGGFGCKLNIYAEEVIAAVAAMRVGKPVKWVEDRAESFLATTHGRDQVAYVEAAATKDGRILGLRMKLIGDLGAYHQLFTPAVPTFSGLMSTGVYKIANLRSEVLGVFTNKTPVDAYRGARCGRLVKLQGSFRGQGHGDGAHRLVAARAGPGDELRATSRGRVGGPDRRHRCPPRRYERRGDGRRHLREPKHGCRRRRADDVPGEGQGQGDPARRSPDGGSPGRHGVLRRPHLREGPPGQGDDDPGGHRGSLPSRGPAAGYGAGDGGDELLRAVKLHVPIRGAHRSG